MILRLAFRNLFRNKKNSIVLMALFFVISLLFFTGNSFTGHISRGMRTSYVDNFTGDMVIKPPTEMEVSLFGAVVPTMDEFYVLPGLDNKAEIEKGLKKLETVEDTTAMVTGAAVMDLSGQRIKVPLFGVPGGDYFDFFNSVTVHEGKTLDPDRKGVMISSFRKRKIEEQTGETLRIGMPVKLTMAGNRGFKIREVPLTGIYSYDRRDPLLDQVVLADLQTVRALNSISLAGSADVEISEDESSFLDMESDSLFDDDSVFGSLDSISDDESFFTNGDSPEGISPDEVEGLAEGIASETKWRGGDFHFILVKLQDGVKYRNAVSSVEKIIESNGFDAEIMDWRGAAGLSARAVYLLKILYNAGFFLIALTGAIVMVNIMLISIFERTPEIGTMRAMGASKGFLVKLIALENFFLIISGIVLGLAGGWLFLEYINSRDILIENNLVVTLLGMEKLNFEPQLSEALITPVVSLLFGMAAIVYPLHRALSIDPGEAQKRGSL